MRPEMRSLHIAVVTVSDSRKQENDLSGNYLIEALSVAGHRLAIRHLVPDELYGLRAHVAGLIADLEVEVVLLTGGTGFAARDVTPEAIEPLLDRQIPGFGELFRSLSLADIGVATIQSRALAGLANGTLVACLPGSPSACRLAWEKLLCQQLDSRTAPCNLVSALAPINR